MTWRRELLRAHQGCKAQPTACIVDSQVVKAHDTVVEKTSGYVQGCPGGSSSRKNAPGS
jgi:hypothetical protein